VIYAILLGAYVMVIFYLARKAAKGESLPARPEMPDDAAALARVPAE